MTTWPSPLLRRVAFALGAQGFGQIVNLVIRLGEVPLFLSFWGPERYGEWLMITAIPTYLALGDGGFATTACRDMTIKSGVGDRTGVVTVFQSTWVLLLGITVLSFILVIGLFQVISIGPMLGLNGKGQYDVELVILLLVTHVLVSFQGGLLNGAYWVEGRYPLAMALNSVTQLIEFLGLASVLTMGGGQGEAAAVYLGGRLCGTGMLLVGKRRVCPWLHYGVDHISVAEVRRLASPALASLAFPLGNALNIQGMRIVVGLALGPIMVATFTALRTVSRLITQPMSIINRISEPELATAYGQQSTELFRRIFLRTSQLAFWAGLVLTCILILVIDQLFLAWTDGQIDMDWTVFWVLIVAAVINVTWYMALLVPYATNRHERAAIFYAMIYGVMCIVLGFVFTKTLGLVGAAIVLLVAEIWMAYIVIRLALHLTSTSRSEFFRTILMPPIFIFKILLFSNTGKSYN